MEWSYFDLLTCSRDQAIFFNRSLYTLDDYEFCMGVYHRKKEGLMKISGLTVCLLVSASASLVAGDRTEVYRGSEDSPLETFLCVASFFSGSGFLTQGLLDIGAACKKRQGEEDSPLLGETTPSSTRSLLRKGCRKLVTSGVCFAGLYYVANSGVSADRRQSFPCFLTGMVSGIMGVGYTLSGLLDVTSCCHTCNGNGIWADLSTTCCLLPLPDTSRSYASRFKIGCAKMCFGTLLAANSYLTLASTSLGEKPLHQD